LYHTVTWCCTTLLPGVRTMFLLSVCTMLSPGGCTTLSPCVGLFPTTATHCQMYLCACASQHMMLQLMHVHPICKWLAQIAVPTHSPCGLLKIASSLGCASAASAAYTSSALCAHPLSPCAEPLLPCLQLRGHGSYSELAEVEGSRRYLKVLLAEDNLINMKVDTLLRLLLLQHLSTTTSATPAF